MGKQFVDAAVQMRGQARQHVVEIGPGIMAVKLGRLHQVHYDRGALTVDCRSVLRDT